MAGGKQSSVRFVAVFVACLAAALIQTTLAATSHTVGGNSGWTIPSPSTLYSTWASQQTFKVGDSLVFNFQTGQHTVAEVSKSAYDACTTSNPISTTTTGPATLKIGSAGNHYYICTISGHCSIGQKLAITATGSSSAAPTSTPKSSPAPTAATPTSSPTSSPSPAAAAAPTPSSSSTSHSPSGAPSTAPSAKSPSGGASGPSPSSAAVPTPSSSGTSHSPSGATSTTPSEKSPSGSAAGPSPSSATFAGAGLGLPFIMIAAAFLV